MDNRKYEEKMEKKILEKYIGSWVLVILKNGFRYTFYFSPSCLNGDTISTIDKFGQNIDFEISAISLIKFTKPSTIKEKEKNG